MSRRWESERKDTKCEGGQRGRRRGGRVIESNRAGEERIDRRGDETERGV